MATPTVSAATKSSDSLAGSQRKTTWHLTNLRVIRRADEPNPRAGSDRVVQTKTSGLFRNRFRFKGRHLDVDEVLARSLPKVARQ